MFHNIDLEQDTLGFPDTNIKHNPKVYKRYFPSKSEHRNHLYVVTSELGEELQEYAKNEQDVRMFVHNCHPTFKVADVELIY